MQERPISLLTNTLRSLGAKIHHVSRETSLPLNIAGQGLEAGQVQLPGNVSSQFVSALMLAGTQMRGNLIIEVLPPAISYSYIQMTESLLKTFGAQVEFSSPNHIRIPGNQTLHPQNIRVEGDWSSASYFFGLAAITGGSVTALGLNVEDRQGDRRFLEVLEVMGCEISWSKEGVKVTGPALQAGSFDMNDMTDVVPTLLSALCLQKGKRSYPASVICDTRNVIA